jgi:hypothetical protein
VIIADGDTYVGKGMCLHEISVVHSSNLTQIIPNVNNLTHN